MKSLADRLADELAAMPEVTAGRSRFSPRRAFFVGSREFLHFHGEHEVDVRLTRKEIRARRPLLEADARVTLRNRHGSSDWMEIRFHRPRDLGAVVALARLAIEANRGS